MSDKPRPDFAPAFDGLRQLARTLRGPQGCPWDRAQTLHGLAAHLVEEAYEVLQAAESADPARLAEEIGDTLFLVALVQTSAEEAGSPGNQAILSKVIEKIVRRHPHVFGEVAAGDAREAARIWEHQKRAERGDPSEGPGDLPAPPPALPALLQAQRLQEKAAAAGFDWPDAEPILEKIEEELSELREALRDPSRGREARLREETGDLLFAVVNLTRRLGIDAEQALRAANTKFRQRYNRMAARLREAGSSVEERSLPELDVVWEEVKREERSEPD